MLPCVFDGLLYCYCLFLNKQQFVLKIKVIYTDIPAARFAQNTKLLTHLITSVNYF